MRPLARLCGPIGWRRLHSRATDALRRIQQLNRELNAVVHTIENSAQTRLHKTDHDSDQKESNATDHGISTSGGVRNAAHDAFDGIPILVKDSIHVQGMPTVCGDAARKSHVAPEDAPLIARRTCCWPAMLVCLLWCEIVRPKRCACSAACGRSDYRQDKRSSHVPRRADLQPSAWYH